MPLPHLTAIEKNIYIDRDRKVTDAYRQAVLDGNLVPLEGDLEPLADGIHRLIQSTYDADVLDEMIADGHEIKVKDNPLNDNFYKEEFQSLWQEINHQYTYRVDFDSQELIDKAVKHINDKLFVARLQYTASIGQQKDYLKVDDIRLGASFTGERTRTEVLNHAGRSQVKYDLLGQVAIDTKLTRRTVASILKGIRSDKYAMFAQNPEAFMGKAAQLINEQKATMIVEHISYDRTAATYDSNIFTAEKTNQGFEKAFVSKKAIQTYVFTDGTAEQSVERRFAEDLDKADEVCVYAKLPRTFQIPTPVGNYSPDWAIAFYEGAVKHIFFVAETKGSMDSMSLRPIEQAKISCAKKLFDKLSNGKVKYHEVKNYQNLLDVMAAI